MRELIGSFLSNESPFGRLMTWIGVIIATNIMFVLCCMPVVTVGASLGAMYHVMLRALRSHGQINPFKEFYKGIKANFKQGTIVWLILAGLAVFGYIDVRICLQADSPVSMIRYAIYAAGLIVLMIVIFIFPVMAAFKNTLPIIIRSAAYFGIKNPGRLIVLLFFQVFPLYLTYSDPQMMPLYAFLWVTFGFGAIALLTSRLLIHDFEKYLPIVDSYGDFILDDDGNLLMPENKEISSPENREKTEEEILEEMKKLDF